MILDPNPYSSPTSDTSTHAATNNGILAKYVLSVLFVALVSATAWLLLVLAFFPYSVHLWHRFLCAGIAAALALVLVRLNYVQTLISTLRITMVMAAIPTCLLLVVELTAAIEPRRIFILPSSSEYIAPVHWLLASTSILGVFFGLCSVPLHHRSAPNLTSLVALTTVLVCGSYLLFWYLAIFGSHAT